MYTKEFDKFVWEEGVEALGLPHFFLGKLELSSTLFLDFYILCPAFIFLGIGSVLSTIVFICENVQIFQTIQS